MTIHEYGKSNAKTVVLVHPSVVMWDFFEYLTQTSHINFSYAP